MESYQGGQGRGGGDIRDAAIGCIWLIALAVIVALGVFLYHLFSG